MGSRGPIAGKNKSSKGVQFASGVPNAPTYLDAAAKREYRRVVKLFADNANYLQQVDWPLLAIYAQTWSDVQRLTKRVREEGETLIGERGGSYLNPTYSALCGAHNRMEKLAAKFGFSPVDRERITATQAKADKVDRFEALRRKGDGDGK